MQCHLDGELHGHGLAALAYEIKTYEICTNEISCCMVHVPGLVF